MRTPNQPVHNHRMETPQTPSLKSSIIRGSINFCLASTLVYLTVAFGERWMYQTLGLTGAYITWTVLFIGFGAAALQPIVAKENRGVKFYAIFGIGFLLYAVGWCGAYFTLRGDTGEWVGSLAGSILMAVVFAVGFKAIKTTLAIAAALFVANSVGYFIGDYLHATIGAKPGMILWGVAHGLGLGAGLGFALHQVQQSAK